MNGIGLCKTSSHLFKFQTLDPVIQHILLSTMNQADPEVHISYYIDGKMSGSQIGIIVKNYIITVSNGVMKNPMDVFITLKYDKNFLRFSPTKIEEKKCQKLQDMLKDYFVSEMNPDTPGLLLKNYKILSTFLILHVPPKIFLENDINADAVPVYSLEPFIPSEEIMVTFMPFEYKEFFNTISSGIVSQTFGDDSVLMITDTRLREESCSGAPIYRVHNNKKRLLGIVLCQLSVKTKNNMHLLPTGFSLGVHISLLGDLLNLDAKPNLNSECVPLTEKCKLLNCLDFVVCIISKNNFSSGIIISNDGLIISNAHCVDFKSGHIVKVQLHGMNYVDGLVVFSAEKGSWLDIAVIQITTKVFLPACSISSEVPRAEEKVYSVGHFPLTKYPTKFISHGVLNPFTSTALCFFGCSGGALVNQNGEAVGMIVGLYYESFNFILLAFIPLFPILSYITHFIKHRDVVILNDMVSNFEKQLSKSKF